jgi:hypothetical protein
MLGVAHLGPSSGDCGTQGAGARKSAGLGRSRGEGPSPPRPASHRSVMPIDLIFHANNAIYRV